MTAFYSFPTPLARGTLARAEKVNENLQAIADSLAYFGDAAKWVDHRPNYIADSGAVNAYVVTLDPVPSAYRVGMTFDMVALLANTGASTVNVNGLGVKTITDSAGAALAAGAIPAGRVTTLVYDGTNFRTIAAVSTTVPADNSVTVAKLATPLSDMAAGLSASWNPATDDTTTLGTATHRWGGAFYKSGGAINWNNGDVTITHSANALTFAGAANGYLFDAAILPLSSDGAAIGSTALMWSDAFLASGAVLNFNNGNYTITHSAGTLTFSAGASFGAALLPTADDGAALGSTTKEWSDLFLATGGVVNWNNGAVLITHSANLLAFSGASSGYTFDAAVSSGTYSASGATAGWTTGKAAVATQSSSKTSTASQTHYQFVNPNGLVGSITTNASATAFNTSSDQRLKENFIDLNASSMIDAIKMYQFSWKADGTRGFGVKAQECFEVFPEAITVGVGALGDEDYMPWSADYSKFVPLLLAEVKALRVRIAALEIAQK